MSVAAAAAADAANNDARAIVHAVILAPNSQTLVCCNGAAARAAIRMALVQACATWPSGILLLADDNDEFVVRFAEHRYESHIKLLDALPPVDDVAVIARADMLFLIGWPPDAIGLARIRDIAAAVRTTIHGGVPPPDPRGGVPPPDPLRKK